LATLRDIRKRISAVTKTQKITRAMKLVAAARFARAQAAIRAARPYAEKLRSVLSSVAAGVSTDAHALLAPRERVRRLDLVVFTSDRGLCGAYNANVSRYAERLAGERGAELDEVRIIPVGRKAEEFFKRRKGAQLVEGWSLLGTVQPGHAQDIATRLIERYLSGETDEVALVYAEFQSALTQRPCHQTLLPLAPDDLEETRSYEVEPDPARLLALLVPRAVEFSIYRALLENQAGEHGARMTAMESATNNTEELIRSLTIDFNKARQASITAELIEIVSGADAL
jgi:F-type H+-transporting ATPase subunit gamma